MYMPHLHELTEGEETYPSYQINEAHISHGSLLAPMPTTRLIHTWQQQFVITHTHTHTHTLHSLR